MKINALCEILLLLSVESLGCQKSKDPQKLNHYIYMFAFEVDISIITLNFSFNILCSFSIYCFNFFSNYV